ncbi:MAG: helix-turn-helix domain-containing protein [Dechloromonas sp.]|nr:helix-turn-helix domain-containing protein [Dechloromonas sp.]
MNATKHLLDWNDYLKTGIDIVDQQHRGLVDLANETAAKLSSGDGLSVDEMRTLLGFLTDYAATHFSTEEALMALSGIDEDHVVHHRQSHANFLNQVNTMVDELGGGELTGEQLMEFLGNWLIYHMLGEDQRLSRLLHNEPASAAETAGGEGAAKLPPLPAHEAANRSLAKLYAFMAERNQQLQATEQAQRTRSNQMTELVAEQTAELAASEERFRALFHNGMLPIIISRLEADLRPGPIIDANPAACLLLGYSPAELLCRSPLDLVAPDEVARFPMLISELLVTGKFECEMTHVTKAGQYLTTQMSMAQFVIHGEPVAMAIIQNLPSNRAAELAQGDIQRQARRLAEIRSGFLSGAGPQAGLAREAVPGQPAGAPGEPMAPAQIADFIAGHDLFTEVAPRDLAQLAAATGARRLQKGEILFEKGARPAGIFLVASGHILLAVSSPQGGKKVLGIFGGGQSIGEAEVVMDSPYPYFAESVDDAEVLEVGQGALLALLDKDKKFARRLMNCLGARQHDLVYSVESYTLRTGAERVIGYLLQHAKIQASGRLIVELPATKQLIASLLHITPETLSRIFRDLSEAGLIEARTRHIQIPDLDRLIAYEV